MKIAVEGCCHGELETIYAAMEKIEKKEGIKIDLLICCGDFQAIRNKRDLECMSVPIKYREMGTFYKYYSGELKRRTRLCSSEAITRRLITCGNSITAVSERQIFTI